MFFRTWKFESIVPLDVRRTRVRARATNSEAYDFFLPSSFVAKSRTNVRRSLATSLASSPTLLSRATRLESAYGSSPEIPGVSGRIGSRRRRPFRETGVIGVQTKPLARGISPRPTHSPISFFPGWNSRDFEARVILHDFWISDPSLSLSFFLSEKFLHTNV